MADAPQPKPWIDAIHAYVPGKSGGAGGRPVVKLSANENPLGTSPAALAARALAAPPSLYPDPDALALRQAIGRVHRLAPERIVCGTGSGELLSIAASAFAGPGDAVIHVRYGFSLYDIVTRRCGATPVVAPDADFGSDVDALLALVDESTRVVFLANPNNPTGSYLRRGELARLHAGLPPQVLLVLDQAYAEYVAPEDDDGGFALAATHRNVLVTRTFSKAYGLAGERVGWATGDERLIQLLNRIRGPFNVAATAQATAIAALGDQDFVHRSREHNRTERERLVAAIEPLGRHRIRPLPSEANFVLLLFEGRLSAEAAYHGLMDRGFIARWLPGQGLPQGLRITLGSEEAMAEVARALHALAEAA